MVHQGNPLSVEEHEESQKIPKVLFRYTKLGIATWVGLTVLASTKFTVLWVRSKTHLAIALGYLATQTGYKVNQFT
jgi:hypothetical protein